MNRLQNLDALRFFLSLIVVLYHIPRLCKNEGLPYFNDFPIFHRGIEAVYMFFVLSGFLIIRIIYRAKYNDSFSIKNFYVRRILRIFPLYYLIVIFGLFFYNVLLPQLQIPFEIKYNILEGILLTTFFMPNIFAVSYEPGGILEILWSIGIEEQFYLIVAPILYLIKKERILVSILLLTSVYFILFHLPGSAQLRKFEFVFHLLFFGGFVSVLEEKNCLVRFKKHKIIPVLITITTFLYFFTNWFDFEKLWLKNLFTTILFGLFIHTLSFNNFGFSIKNKWINYFGKVSFGIYMYHIIILNGVVFLFLKLSKIEIFNEYLIIVLINILTLILTIIISHLSYQYFEKFFLKLKRNYK